MNSTPSFRAPVFGALLVLGAMGLRADVYINEFMVDNPGQPNDPNAKLDIDGNSPGWIELRNNGAASVTLTGWALSDEPSNPGKWIFAAPVAPATTHTTIPANGYKLVFCGGILRNIANVEPHTPFKLDGSGQILLSQPDGSGGWTVVSQIGTVAVPYPSQRRAVSYGYPNNDKNLAPVFFENDTPAATNGPTGVSAFAKDTSFDVDRGFYDAPFTLHITSATPGATIVYTLNGTQPTATNGTQVAAPDAATPPTASLSIAGTTIVRARAIAAGMGASNVDTQTYIFPAEVLTQTGPLPSMGLTVNDTAAWGTVNSGGGVRTPAGPDWAVETGATQYPNALNRFTADDLKKLPVVSVVTAWREAFGPNPSSPDYAATPIANRGFYVGPEVGVAEEQADRACSMEYINPLGDPAAPNAHRDSPVSPWINRGFQVDGNVHVFGGTSQDRWKSYKLSMRVKAEEDVTFNLYGDDASDVQSTFILDARLNQAWLHSDATQRSRGDYVRDHVMADLQNAMGGTTFHTRPVHYFLNGLYWGLYLLHEKPDDQMEADYRGGSQSDWDIFKHSAIAGVDGAGNAFAQVISAQPLDPALPLGSSTVTALNTAASFYNATTLKNYEALLDLLGIGRVAPNPVPDLTQQAAYDAVAAKLDIPDFINYILLNCVAANTDWPHKNYYAALRRTDPNGKWHFNSWDAEHVFKDVADNTFTQGNWAADASGPGAVTRRLATSPEFRLAFADAAQKHLFNNGILSVAGLQAAFNRRFAEVEPWGIRGESARWGDNRSTAGQPHAYTTNGGFATPVWTTEKNRLLNTVMPARANLAPAATTSALGQMKAFAGGALYPAIVAPDFQNAATNASQHGGSVPLNFQLKINNAGAAATVYYTLDGSDPRTRWTSAAAPTAAVYTAPVTLTASTTVKARVLNGTTWSALTEAFFAVSVVPATAANLVVSKIHYHPADATPSEIQAGITDADEFEFIELMNISSTSSVDLQGVSFGVGLDYTFNAASAVKVLAPGGRVLVVKRAASFAVRYGAGLPVAGEFVNLSGLSNSGERIQLFGPDGPDADSLPDAIRDFTYNDKAPWPQVADGMGPSLVLIAPTSSPNHADPANWRASTDPLTGPAGQPNADDRVLFGGWKSGAFLAAEQGDPAISGPGADPDGDGLTNLMEFALGSDPKVAGPAAHGPLAGAAFFNEATPPADYATFTVIRDPAREELLWETAISGNLGQWFGDAGHLVEISRTVRPDGWVETLHRSATPLSATTREFFRTKVLLP